MNFKLKTKLLTLSLIILFNGCYYGTSELWKIKPFYQTDKLTLDLDIEKEDVSKYNLNVIFSYYEKIDSVSIDSIKLNDQKLPSEFNSPKLTFSDSNRSVYTIHLKEYMLENNNEFQIWGKSFKQEGSKLLLEKLLFQKNTSKKWKGPLIDLFEAAMGV